LLRIYRLSGFVFANPSMNDALKHRILTDPERGAQMHAAATAGVGRGKTF